MCFIHPMYKVKEYLVIDKKAEGIKRLHISIVPSQVEMRAQLEKKMAQKEKVRKEELLKVLARKAREEHAGLVSSGLTDEAEREREKLRQDRAR